MTENAKINNANTAFQNPEFFFMKASLNIFPIRLLAQNTYSKLMDKTHSKFHLCKR